MAAFDPTVTRIKRGVYVHYLRNDHEHPVYDRNRRGKLLILPGRTTIKFGKFEGGLIARRSEDARHFHRREFTDAPSPAADAAGHRGSLQTFPECVRLALVLDLTGHRKVRVREAEGILRAGMRTFLADLSLEVQNHRGDYRILLDAAPPNFAQRLKAWALNAFAEIDFALGRPR